jgi:hypothetical protein
MFRLLRDVSAGIRVLQHRDGVALSENQILERASNIVMGLVGNFRIEALDLDEEPARAVGNAPEIQVEEYGTEISVMA